MGVRPFSRFAWSRQRLRLQFTALYAGLLLVLGAVILAIAGLPIRGHAATFRAVNGSRANSAIAASQHAADVHQLNIGSAIAVVVALVLSVVLGWFIAGRLLRPLQTITATARDISAHNLHRRLNLSGADNELKQLGATLDELFGRLEASFESQRHFAANASHELRTPLAAERSLLQVALADPETDVATLRSTCEEVLRLGVLQESLVDSLLTLASSEAGVERWEPLDLAQIAGSAVIARLHEAEQREIHVTTAFAAAPMSGDPVLVEILVANIIENALRHNDPSGRVDITTFAEGAVSSLRVTNTGPAISPQDIHRLLGAFQRQRGERVDSASGHGLGLAIVRAVVDAHGAQLEVEPHAGGGLRVEVRFGRP